MNWIYHRCKSSEAVQRNVWPVCTSMCFLPCRASGVLGLNCSLARFRAMALLLISCCLCVSTGSGWAVCQRWVITHICKIKWQKDRQTQWGSSIVKCMFHTYSWYDVLGVSVSSDNTTVIHNVSIITWCPTLSRKNTVQPCSQFISSWRWHLLGVKGLFTLLVSKEIRWFMLCWCLTVE